MSDAVQASAPGLGVLFVCTANISRSPWLELTARHRAGPRSGVRFSSAGTHGTDGTTMDPAMVPLLDDPAAADQFRSRALTPMLLRGADLVLTAQHSHRDWILTEHPDLFRRVFVLGQLASTVAARPSERGRALVAWAARHRDRPRDEHDVADPFRRGDAAARTAACTMSTMLSMILPLLEETV